MASIDGGQGRADWPASERMGPRWVATGAVLFTTLQMPTTLVRTIGSWPRATTPVTPRGFRSTLGRLGSRLLGR